MSPPFKEPDVYSSTEQVCVFPVAEKKFVTMGAGVTEFVRLAGRIVERGFNLVTFLKFLAILFSNSYE